MNKYEWKDAENGTHYFWRSEDGRIVGQIWNYAHTKIWGAKIPVTPSEELLLGQFVTSDFAKKSIQNYWDIQDRTLIE